MAEESDVSEKVERNTEESKNKLKKIASSVEEIATKVKSEDEYEKLKEKYRKSSKLPEEEARRLEEIKRRLEQEREERGYGTITGGIEEKSTRKPLPEAEVIAFSPEIQRDIPGDVYVDKEDKKTKFTIQVPTTNKGILYTIYAQASKHKRSTRKQVVVKNDDKTKDIGTLELEPEEKPTTIPFTIKWFEDWTKNKGNWVRLGIAFAITLAVNFWLYRPLISGIGIESNFIMDVILPFLFFFVMFFTLPKEFKNPGDWSPIVLGVLVAGGTMYALNLRTGIELAPFIRFGIPLIVYYIVWYFTTKNIEKKRGLIPTIVGIAGLLALVGVGIFLFTLIQSGGLTNMETYLKPLNILHLIGVPQDTIDNMKDGIRNILSFLQFKAVEPVKPEAKKIGGFEAIQLKFGSKYNNYLLPTLFAKMDYSLPVSIINPNSLTSPIPADKLTIRNFYITDVFLNNRSDNRIMCGNIIECTIKSGCEITPESEKTLTLDFNNDEKCEGIVKEYRPNVVEPLYPVKISQDIDSVIADCKNKCEEKTRAEEKATCLKGCDDKQQACNSWCNKGWMKLAPKKAELSGNNCKCEFKRIQNIMDELCFMNNDKATIELKSNYDFSVEGKGELIIVQKETDKKLAPKPSITSSAGPLTITTYFVPDIIVLDKEVKTTKMFVQISNDGDGVATIKLPIDKLGSTKGNLEPKYDAGILKITSCVPAAKEIFVGEEDSTIVCDVTAPSSISGNYLTSPVIVNINYTYSQEHSITLNVRKAYIPEGVDDERAKELNRQFFSLPYYCPTKTITDPPFNTAPLDIYK